MTSRWLSIVGLGEDGLRGLCPAARDALEAADLVVGGARHLALAGISQNRALAWASPIEQTFPAILARRGSPICVLASGDPFFYGVGSLLARHVDAAEIACWPQPSAFSLAAARLGWALQDCITITLHGRPLERVIPLLRDGAQILALSWDGRTPLALADLLCRQGFGRSRLTVCERLGGAHERLRTVSANAFDLGEVAALNTIALVVEADPGTAMRPLTPGLPDEWFSHDGQITKARIRAMTLSALRPAPGQVLWDVGAGSGSIGIEWMLAHPTCRTIAIEAHPDRAARVEHNARQLGVPDLRLIHGRAPDALRDLPAPDAIFIGGGARAAGLIELCQDRLKTGGRLVINAVTVETQSLLSSCFTTHGGDLCTLSIAQAEPVGRFHGWRPAMPVTQWVWVKP